MEAYRSGHNGPDSKSGSPHGLVGSNPTASARQGSPCSESAVILYKGESLRPYLGSLSRLDPFVRTPCSEFAVILYKGESLCPYLGSFVRLDPFVRTRRSEYAVILYNGESLCPYLGSLCRLDPFVQTRRPESRPGRTDGAGSFPGNRGNTI